MSGIQWRKPDFTQAQLREILLYDRLTGRWKWLIDRNHKTLAGMTAGCINKSDGRWYIKVFSQRYSVSRLTWFYMTGKWPKRDIEHEDGDKTNNRWKNLRKATRTQNAGNSKSRVALKGVTRVRTGKYTAQIQKKLRKIHLGTFDTPQEAHAAYVAKAKKLFGVFARAA